MSIKFLSCHLYGDGIYRSSTPPSPLSPQVSSLRSSVAWSGGEGGGGAGEESLWSVEQPAGSWGHGGEISNNGDFRG